MFLRRISEAEFDIRSRLPFGLRRPEVRELPQVVHYHVEAKALQIPGEPFSIRETRGRLDDVKAAVELENGFDASDELATELVAHCRTAGKSWTQVGQALGPAETAADRAASMTAT